MNAILTLLVSLTLVSCASTNKDFNREPNQVGGGSGDMGSVAMSRMQTACLLSLTSFDDGKDVTHIPLPVTISGSYKNGDFNLSFDHVISPIKAYGIITQTRKKSKLEFGTVLQLTDIPSGHYTVQMSDVDFTSPVLQGDYINVSFGYKKDFPKVKISGKEIKISSASLTCNFSK